VLRHLHIAIHVDSIIDERAFMAYVLPDNNVYMQLEIRRKRRTNRMLVAMVTIFVVCWLPLNLLHMAQEYSSAVMRWRYFLLTFLITHVIAMSSTIYNPFLYAWMNDNFKKEFQQVPQNDVIFIFYQTLYFLTGKRIPYPVS